MLAALTALALALTAVPALAADLLEDPGSLTVAPNAGAAGGDALILPRGDLLNVRNIQGGVIGDTNLDIGAGSTQHPGDLVLQYDVGTGRVLFYDGEKRLVARVGPRRAVFRVPVVFRAGLRVRRR
jgi:hypothetical protein